MRKKTKGLIRPSLKRHNLKQDLYISGYLIIPILLGRRRSYLPLGEWNVVFSSLHFSLAQESVLGKVKALFGLAGSSLFLLYSDIEYRL